MSGAHMALKATVETIEGLPADVAKEYKEVEQEGKKVFVLDVEGGEDTGALKRAKDHEKKARQEAEKRLKEIETARDQLDEEINEMRRGNIPKGDVEKLEKSWREKNEKITKDFTEQVAARDRTLQKLLIDNVAVKMATDLSGEAAHLILPHIRQRLTTEIQDGNFVTRVLDAEGKPSAASIEELQKEFTHDKRFAPIIVGSKASGGGASGGGRGSSGSPGFDPKKFDPNKATPRELVDFQKWKREQAK